MTDQPRPAAIAKLLVVCAALGSAVGLVFHLFEEALHHTQQWIWVDLAGDRPSAIVTIAIATVGGVLLGIALWLVPGHGGDHPADGHHGVAAPPSDTRPSALLGSLFVGFLGLAAGASLGPEGALLPAAAGLSVLAARQARVGGAMDQLVVAAGLGALMAALFSHPLAGAVVLLEVVPVAAGMPVVMLLLPTLTSSAFAVLTLQVLGAAPLARLPLDYGGFRPVHLVWAVLIGVIAGAAGLMIDRLLPLLRSLTRRLDARHVVLTTTVGGLVLGVLYAVGGDEARFSGFPELVRFVAGEPGVGTVVVVLLVKALATAWCLAAGYRGGKIFPAAFVGGATGLAVHLVIPSIPISLALAVGMSAAMVTALGLPVTALLSSVALLPADLLPLGVLGGVVAFSVHLLADRLVPPTTDPSPVLQQG